MNKIEDPNFVFEKNYIQKKINEKDGNFFIEQFEKLNKTNILRILDNIGQIPEDFPIEPFLHLKDHLQNQKIRFLFVKHLGKIKNEESVNILKNMLNKEENTLIKREIVSSIGRQRKPENIDCMLNMLNDKDPKIIMQAIRSLLIFKTNDIVFNSLKSLMNHPNETIREILNIELNENHNTNKISSEFIDLQIKKYIKNTVVLGDAYETLKLLPEGCIQLTFTSPPYYNARDYSIYNSYEQYLDFLTRIFKEIYRVTEEGRFFILNTSPVLVPRFSREYSSHRFAIPFDIHPRLIEMGFEFIDDIIWKKPDPSAKNRNGVFFQHRKPLTYKPNSVTEYIMVYRKKSNNLVDWNIQKYSNEIIESSKVKEDYEKTNVWKIAPANDKIHTAVFPETLVYWIIKLYSYIGDIICDPFAGSGTVGAVCKKTKRFFFLTEINKEYFKRIKQKLINNTLFNLNPYNFTDYSHFFKKINNILNPYQEK